MSSLEQAIELAKQLLAKQDYSRQMLLEKLVKRGVSHADASGAVAACDKVGWLDDHRFVERYCQRRMAQGYGPFKIADELMNKKISSSLVTQVLAQIGNEAWIHAGRESLKNKFPHLCFEKYQVQWRQQMRFLEARGFSEDQLFEILQEEEV